MSSAAPISLDPELAARARRELGRTHDELAVLLGVSGCDVRDYETGAVALSVRSVRILTLLLAAHRRGRGTCPAECWQVRGCAEADREQCPAYRLNGGEMCWLLTDEFYRGDSRPAPCAGNEACAACTLFRLLCERGWPEEAEAAGTVLCGMPRPERALSRV